MKGNTLNNMSDSVNPQDVATKKYADKRLHIIAVHTSYHGSLRKDEYQFDFGGNISPYFNTAFCVPHSCHIKRIRMKIMYGRIGVRCLSTFGSYFTIVAVRNNNGEVSDLLTYECNEHAWSQFDSVNIPISEGDIINIRTEKDYIEVDYRGNIICNSYFFTFLLELDPL